MVIDLLGVIEDGSTPGLTVPSSARKTLLVQRGADVLIKLRIKRRSGVTFVPPPVDAGNAVKFVVKQKPELDALLDVAGVLLLADDAPGYSFTITDDDLKRIEPSGKGARFVYDVRLTVAGLVDYIVPLSTFVVGATA